MIQGAKMLLAAMMVLGMMMEGVRGAVCDSNPCVNNGVCVDGGATYTCNCYTGTSGTNCENIDVPAPSTCFTLTFKSVTYDKATTTTTYCYDAFVEDHALCLQSSLTVLSDCLNNFSASQPDGATMTYRGPSWAGPFIAYSNQLCFTLDDVINLDSFDLSNPLSQFSPSGFVQAPYCQINGCEPNLCQNDATCLDQHAGYLCACPIGFDGPECTINLDDCGNNDCVNGVCVDGINTYTCSCTAGWEGDKCDVEKNECASNPCYYGSTCVDGFNGVTCLCKDGYTGEFCQTEINECDPNPCQNGATCHDYINRFTCECPAGYTGTDCSSLLPNNCGSVSLSSSCYDGFTDKSNYCITVQTNADASCTFSKFTIWSDCGNTFFATPPGATHFNNFGTKGVTWTFPGSPSSSYEFCLEYPGYVSFMRNPALVKFSGGDMMVTTSTPFCDINECSNSPCQNGGTCIDSVNSFICDCPDGFKGSRCQTSF